MKLEKKPLKQITFLSHLQMQYIISTLEHVVLFLMKAADL